MSRTPALRRDSDGRAYIRVSAKVARLIAGEEDLTEWSDEEIVRGRALSKRGKFEGQTPSVVPHAVYQEWARRQLEQGFAELIGDLPELLRAVLAIAKDPEVDENTRLRAADMALDRILGRPREKMELDLHGAVQHEVQPLQFVVNEDELWPDDAHVVDAEIVEGDDDDWTF